MRLHPQGIGHARLSEIADSINENASSTTSRRHAIRKARYGAQAAAATSTDIGRPHRP